MRFSLLTILVLSLMGCTSASPPGYASRLLGYPAPERGVELTYCGLAEDPDARTCFADAISGDHAVEIVAAHLTSEGDPVFDIVRRLGPGVVKVYEDRTQDRGAAPPLRIEMKCHSVSVGEESESVVVGDCESEVSSWEPMRLERSQDLYMPEGDLGSSGPSPHQQNLRS